MLYQQIKIGSKKVDQLISRRVYFFIFLFYTYKTLDNIRIYAII